MKNILIYLLLFSSILNAQFTINGKIHNYPNQRVVVKLNKAFEDILIGNISTNSEGAFSIPVKNSYKGIINISLFDAQQNALLISDNSDITFDYTLTPPNKNIIINSAGNKINEVYQNYQNYQTKKNIILPKLKDVSIFYKNQDNFYAPLQKEILNINNLQQPEISSYPYLSYYTSTLELIKNVENANPSNKNSVLQSIKNHFINAGEEFETDGLGKNLIFNYFSLLTKEVQTRKEWTDKIDTAIESLLEEIGEDTNRGQEMLSASINYLKTYGVNDLANKYLSRAESLTCEISPELKNTITKNNSIKVGKKIPNIKFTHKLNGKYNSLYDVKSKYKLIMVWASWCSHCQLELPAIKSFYDNFKKSGGELIALSADYDETQWKETIKDTPWLNDSDLLYWDSRFVKELNINGTPTFFLVDKDNKIVKITSKITDISNNIKIN